MAFNDTLDYIEFTDTFSTYHPKAAKIDILSKCTFNNLQDIPRHATKPSFNKFKKTEILSSIFPDQNGMKSDINYKNTEKYRNTWRLKNMLLHTNGFTRSRKKSKDTLRQVKMKTQ